MIEPSYLLLALGILGGTDILLYHSISHGIRSHEESRWELVTHAMRGPTYAILFLVIPNLELRGAWAVWLAALLVVDVAISVADFWLEGRSRANLGGLPSGEYVLHMIMAMLFGAFVMTVTPRLIGSVGEHTALMRPVQPPAFWVRSVLALFAIGVMWSGVLDFVAVLRLSDRKVGSHR